MLRCLIKSDTEKKNSRQYPSYYNALQHSIYISVRRDKTCKCNKKNLTLKK